MGQEMKEGQILLWNKVRGGRFLSGGAEGAQEGTEMNQEEGAFLIISPGVSGTMLKSGYGWV